jgi:hypothetical protein
MKKILPLALSLISVCHAAFHVANQNVMSEVQTYVKGDKKIVLIDMVHIGPRKFYKNVNTKLSEYKNDNAIVLQEGVSQCHKSGDLLYLPKETTKFKAFEKAFKNRSLIPQEEAVKLLASMDFQSSKCSDKVSDEQPKFLDRFLSRFSLYGIIAGVGLMRSQGTMKVYPRGVQLENGDVASSGFHHPFMNALSGSIVECMLNVAREKNCIAFKEWSKTDSGKKLIDEFILDTRNDVLLAKSLNALNEEVPNLTDSYDVSGNDKKTKTVILPWGADHMPKGLLKSIEQAGFKKVEGQKGIVYTSCKRMRRNIVLNLIFMDNENVRENCQ